jgi:hypothetical protein
MSEFMVRNWVFNAKKSDMGMEFYLLEWGI